MPQNMVRKKIERKNNYFLSFPGEKVRLKVGGVDWSKG
jgi:hypothetical protein